MPESRKNTFGSPMPVFRVKHVDASISYYLEALGFELRWRAGMGSFDCAAASPSRNATFNLWYPDRHPANLKNADAGQARFLWK